MMAAPTKIMLVDDHQLLVDGVEELLQKNDKIKVVATANTAELALEMLKQTRVEIVISDINLPEMKGAELIKEIKKLYPDIKVIALSMHHEKHIIKDVLKAGADGYVLKDSTQHELLEAIEKTMQGETFVSPAVTKMLVDGIKYPGIEELLSDREREIIRLVVQEYTAKQIAEALFISEKTVEAHKRNIFRKTDTATLVGLTKFAIERQLT